VGRRGRRDMGKSRHALRAPERCPGRERRWEGRRGRFVLLLWWPARKDVA